LARIATVATLADRGQFDHLRSVRGGLPEQGQPRDTRVCHRWLGSELSLRRNRAALDRIAVEQRVGMDVRNIDLTTTFLGMNLPLPFTVCPMGGMPQVWPQGDMEMARGATVDGTMGVVNSGGPVKERMEVAGGPLMYQLYNTGDRDWAARRLAEVEAVGYRAIVLTVDTGVQSRRDFHMEALYAANGGQARYLDPSPPATTQHTFR
jgi:isopentenyl diphosphate isomerase/L-lactate dehydrogenase-like FMN-dependent dehydrogenase